MNLSNHWYFQLLRWFQGGHCKCCFCFVHIWYVRFSLRKIGTHQRSRPHGEGESWRNGAAIYGCRSLHSLHIMKIGLGKTSRYRTKFNPQTLKKTMACLLENWKTKAGSCLENKWCATHVHHPFESSWWFQPVWNKLVKLDHVPR